MKLTIEIAVFDIDESRFVIMEDRTDIPLLLFLHQKWHKFVHYTHIDVTPVVPTDYHLQLRRIQSSIEKESIHTLPRHFRGSHIPT